MSIEPHAKSHVRVAFTIGMSALPFTVAILLVATSPSLAQRADQTPPATEARKSEPRPGGLPQPTITAGRIEIGAATLAYTAAAGHLTLSDAAGAPSADIFHVAYRIPSLAAAPRPITFAFNGGPGAASAFLHLSAMGPLVAPFAADGHLTEAGTLLANPDTWLPFTDLVFVDPVATGYSRARSDEAEKSYLGIDKDAESMAEFIRLWLERQGRSAAPVFLAGESYGGFRVAHLAGRLLAMGIPVKGLVLISPALDFALIRGGRRAVLPAALLLPSLAATHHELTTGAPANPADLAAVEAFALSEYLVHIAGRIGRNPPLEARVAGFTGLPVETVARHFSRVTTSVFLDDRERMAGRAISRYDATISAAMPRSSDAHHFDPVLDQMVAGLAQAFAHYARSRLGYATDRPYRVLNREINSKWTYGGRRQGYASALDALQAARIRAPQLRILAVNGSTDLVTTYMATRHAIGQLEPIDGAAEPVVKAYPGGHMMYLRPQSRRMLTEDASRLYANALGGT